MLTEISEAKANDKRQTMSGGRCLTEKPLSFASEVEEERSPKIKEGELEREIREGKGRESEFSSLRKERICSIRWRVALNMNEELPNMSQQRQPRRWRERGDHPFVSSPAAELGAGPREGEEDFRLIIGG